MSNQTEDLPTDTKKHRGIVKKPKKYLKPRQGRGFSPNEIKSASIPLDDAKKMPIIIDLRRRSVHEDNVQLLSAMYREVVSRQTEERTKLDRTTKQTIKALKQLRNMKTSEAKLLIEAGIKTLKMLAEEEPVALADDLASKINPAKVERWITHAKDLLKRKGFNAAIEELLKIRGVNKTYAKKLVNFGILNIEDLSNENAEILSKDIKISEKIITVWIEDAMRQTGKPVPKKKPSVKKPKKAKKKKPPAKKPEPSKEEAPVLTDIEDLGKGDIKELKNLGITKIQDLAKEDAKEIASITGINEHTVQTWINKAKQLMGLTVEPAIPEKKEPIPPEEESVDPLIELIKLPRVGKKTAEKLVSAGITSCSDLVECDPKSLSKDSKVSEKTLKKIIAAAKKELE